MKSSVAVFLRVDQLKKDGSAGLYLRIRIGKQKTDLSIGKNLSPKASISLERLVSMPPIDRVNYYNWNEKSGKVTTGNQLSESINAFISSERARAEKIFIQYGLKGKKITKALFKAEFLKKSENHLLLAKDYFINHIEQRKETYSKETIRSYKSIVTKME